MRMPGDKNWSCGVCTRLAGPRSYIVMVGGKEYRQNRRQLIYTDKHQPSEFKTQVPTEALSAELTEEHLEPPGDRGVTPKELP